MNTTILTHIVRFVLLFILQVFILNYLEIGYGIHMMIYPIFILLLPVELNVFYLMLIAFGFGGLIDIFSDTFGMHASAAVMFAYFRPIIFKLFAPRDGYDILMETNMFQMGFGWFLRTFGILLLIHHLWFFILMIFRISEILYILQMTGLSAALSFILCILYQQLFLRKPKKEA
ncbi:MAG: hypothetical protein NXI10_03030 [bacterium]|nr:hypothetical protein [bacterium]